MTITVAVHLARHGLQGLAATLQVHQVDLRGDTVDLLPVRPRAVRATLVHPEAEEAVQTEEVVVGHRTAILQELLSSLSGYAEPNS